MLNLLLIVQVVSGLDGIPRQIDLNVATEFTLSLPDSSATVCAVLRSLVDGSTVQCQVSESRERGGEYHVSVVPGTRGRHELSIMSAGVEVEGSPFKVFVRCSPQLMGRPVHVIEGVSRPAGVALRGDSEMVVTEMEPAAVCVRDRHGKMIRSFEQESPQLDNPYGVAIDSEGCVYVAELINCKVHKFSKDGEIIKAVGGECGDSGDNGDSGRVAFPAGIKISRNDHIYICDDMSQKVLVFDKNLDFLFSFGEMGDKPGQFQSPSDVAFDSDGNVFVADTKRERIMKFSPRGEFELEFEMKGQSSELELGICVSNSGQMYVSDFWNHRVVVFNTAGEFVTAFGKKGSAPGEFDMPAGIAVDEDGYVYVCDQRNSRVQVF